MARKRKTIAWRPEEHPRFEQWVAKQNNFSAAVVDLVEGEDNYSLRDVRLELRSVLDEVQALRRDMCQLQVVSVKGNDDDGEEDEMAKVLDNQIFW